MKNINFSLIIFFLFFSFVLYSCTTTNREDPSKLTYRQQRIYFPLDRCDIENVITEKRNLKYNSKKENESLYKQKNEITSTIELINQAYFIADRRQYRNVVRKDVITLAININDYTAAARLIELSNPDIVNNTDLCGNTAAMYIPFSDMRMSEKESLYSLLINKGLDINRKNSKQQTALILAAKLVESPKILEIISSLSNVDITLNDSKNLVAWDYVQMNDKLRSKNISNLFVFTNFQRYIEEIKDRNRFNESFAQVIANEVLTNSTLQLNTYQYFRIIRYLKNPTAIIEELKNNYNLNITDSVGQNALFEAVHNVYGASSAKKTIQALVKAGINVNQQDINGNTALMHALREDAHKTILKSLVSSGTDLTLQNKDKSNALFFAAYYSSNVTAILSSLLKAKLSVDDVNSANETPLLLAAKGINASDKSVMNKLMAKSKNIFFIDQDGNNLFHLLIKHIDSESFFRRFSNNPQVFLQRNNEGVTPIHLLAQYYTKNTNFIRTLAKRSKLQFSVLRDNKGKTPLMYAVEHNSNSDIVSYLVIYTSDPNSTDLNGNNVLMYAVRNIHDVKIPILILDKTEDINSVNDDKITALMFAAQYSPFSTLLESILAKGAIISQRNTLGQTCLMLSTLNVLNPYSTQTLIENGARTNDLDTKGQSSIIYAGKHSIYLEHVQALLNRNADRYAVDLEGKSFFDYVEKNPSLLGFFKR